MGVAHLFEKFMDFGRDEVGLAVVEFTGQFAGDAEGSFPDRRQHPVDECDHLGHGGEVASLGVELEPAEESEVTLFHRPGGRVVHQRAVDLDGGSGAVVRHLCISLGDRCISSVDLCISLGRIEFVELAVAPAGTREVDRAGAEGEDVAQTDFSLVEFDAAALQLARQRARMHADFTGGGRDRNGFVIHGHSGVLHQRALHQFSGLALGMVGRRAYPSGWYPVGRTLDFFLRRLAIRAPAKGWWGVWGLPSMPIDVVP